jgi:hypothetical protein
MFDEYCDNAGSLMVGVLVRWAYLDEDASWGPLPDEPLQAQATDGLKS